MTTKPNYCGPAFPIPAVVNSNGDVQPGWDGMTLRDYFAAKATEQDIAEFMPQTIGEVEQFRRDHGYWPTRQWARYQHADAMLAERDKEQAQ